MAVAANLFPTSNSTISAASNQAGTTSDANGSGIAQLENFFNQSTGINQDQILGSTGGAIQDTTSGASFSSDFTTQGAINLGTFAFTSMAVPDNVKFGLREGMNIHKMMGGNRQIDMVGDDPSDFHWSGTFFGPDAVTNANTLYKLQQEKKSQKLSFGEVVRNVVISELDLNYRTQFRIEYAITCVVVNQTTDTGFAGDDGEDLGIDGGILTAGDSLIGAANGLLGGAGSVIDAASGLIGGVTGQLLTLGASGTSLITSTLGQVQGVIAGASGIVGTAQGVVQNGANLVSAITGIPISIPTVNGFLSQTQAAINTGANMVGTLQNISTNTSQFIDGIKYL